jgi:hypothetical protein
MKPAWTSLGQTYSSQDEVLIATVDCTAEGRLCEEQGIEGARGTPDMRPSLFTVEPCMQ